MSTEPRILYSDEFIIAIAKPALIHSVSQKSGSERSIAAWLVSSFPECADSAENPDDGGLINRLDFETSGILIAARTRELWRSLRDQFSRFEISKTYLAILEGMPKVPTSIEGFIGNRYRGSKKVTLRSHAEKRFQHTHSIIQKILNCSHGNENSIVEITALTGARHQIRIHCASIGHPLLGDSLYGSKGTLAIKPGLTFALHAASISFIHPHHGARQVFLAPVPSYFPLVPSAG